LEHNGEGKRNRTHHNRTTRSDLTSKELLEVGLNDGGVGGLAQDLQEIIISYEVEPGKGRALLVHTQRMDTCTCTRTRTHTHAHTHTGDGFSVMLTFINVQERQQSRTRGMVWLLLFVVVF